MVTIRDVAAKAGVSTSTVSHVVNNTRFVRDETRERVEQAMQELQYQPNRLASSLRSRKTQTLGVLMPNSANPYFARILAAIEERSYERGYNVIIGNVSNPQREEEYLAVMLSKQIDGMLLISTGNFAHSIDRLKDVDIPVVLVDRPPQRDDIDVVMADNHDGGKTATQYLLDLGHRDIACITGPAHLITSTARRDGYIQALHEANIEPLPHWIVSGDFDHESGYRAALQILQQQDQRPTAIFASNDMMAIGAMRAVNELGLTIPDDISLIGFDNISLSAYTLPPLTTIEQPVDAMGAEAVEKLLYRIDHPDKNYQRDTLPVQLITRQSCKMMT